MNLEQKASNADPHHLMLAGSGAGIGYLSYLLWPAYFVAPYLALGAGALGFYAAARLAH